MELMEAILIKENLNQAYKKVVANKGASEFNLLKEREVQNQKDGTMRVDGISYNKRMVNIIETIFKKRKMK